jgi:hypothetical protein
MKLISRHISIFPRATHLFKSWKLFCAMFPFFIAATPSASQTVDNYAVHANIIYHFTKYIDWPASRKSGDFIIGVYGDSPLYDELKKNVANKTVGMQKILIKKIGSVESAKSAHILFVSEEMSGSIKKISTTTTDNSVLIVSEQEGSAKRGSCINFIIESEHLKLEINQTNIEQRDLSIASELLQLGKAVK